MQMGFTSRVQDGEHTFKKGGKVRREDPAAHRMWGEEAEDG